MEGLTVGDIVHIKSDSANIMTVDWISASAIDCVWFVNGILNKATFDVNALQISKQ